MKFKSPKAEASSDQATPERLDILAGDMDVAVQRAVARNTHTPPAALERLSHSTDKAVREAVTGNANSPVAVLTRLGSQFPIQLLGNPAFDWMVLENPGLFSEVPDDTLAAIAKREDCTAEMLAHLAQSGHGWGLLMALVQNGRTPVAAIRRIIESSADDLAERFEVTKDRIEQIQKLAAMHVCVVDAPSADEARERFLEALTTRLVMSRMEVDEWSLFWRSEVPGCIKHDVLSMNRVYRGKSVDEDTKRALIKKGSLPFFVLECLVDDEEPKIRRLAKDELKKRHATPANMDAN
jgi:hypothetical protein